ncbi:MAG: cobalamin-binding protein [Verrucomicrobiota bacterium]|nr:cobalamin-binding protein [Verrucomicrobiota bacterium]
MRIVSLLPAATEIVAALGLSDQLVGVSHECDFPPTVAHKPRVTRCLIDTARLPSDEIDRKVAETIAADGTLYQIDEALLRRLKPEVILTQRLCDVCAVGYGSVARMAATLPGPPRLVNLEPSSLADVFREIGVVAAKLNAAEVGERLVAESTQRIEAVRKRAAEATQRPRCFVMEWIDPPYSAGHWNPELVEIAGGEEPLGQRGEKSGLIEWSSVVAAQPEVIVLACCGHSIERMRKDLPILHRYEGWSDLPAVRAGRVYAVDGNAYFTRPGPRLVDGVEILAGILHPELFPKFLPAHWPAESVTIL